MYVCCAYLDYCNQIEITTFNCYIVEGYARASPLRYRDRLDKSLAFFNSSSPSFGGDILNVISEVDGLVSSLIILSLASRKTRTLSCRKGLGSPDLWMYRSKGKPAG